MNESENKIDYSALKAEYISTNLSLAKLAEKHGIGLSYLKRRAVTEKWSEQRKRQAEKNGRRIAEQLNDSIVKDTVKDIEAVCKAARKLIKKANTAISQVDREQYISHVKTSETAQESENDGVSSVVVTKDIEQNRTTIKTLIDTKRLEQLSKTLLNIKQILSDNDDEDEEDIGVIELPEMEKLTPPSDEEEDKDG